jgi:uncharacterized protein YndB with AHSA1/START domain
MFTQLPSGPEILLVEADFPSASPLTLFNYWTEPSLLQQWWPQEAELQPQMNGSYHLSWFRMNWHLRGHYTHFEPGKFLAFTWRWDHDPSEEATREVTITFSPAATGGTHILLSHGPYANTPEDQELRIEHHLAGWEHFLGRLQEAVAARVSL